MPPPPPAAATGPGLPPPLQVPEPPRASWWSVGAVFVTLILSGVVVVSLSDGSDADDANLVVTAMILGLALGAVLANLTPIGRVFRRWSSVVVAMIVGIVLLFVLAAAGGGLGSEGATVLLGGLCVIAALDLCYVSRLRVMVILSGVCMIPVVAALESSGLFSGFAWFTSAMFALWLLSVDEQRSLPRPEPVDGIVGQPRARGADLVRTVAMALLAGFTLAFLMSTPSCSFRPLANALDWLPWHPTISPKYVPSLDQPVRLPELDDEGQESIPYLDKEGRRFLIDPTTAEPFGLVARDGADVVVSRGGREVARFDDGGLVVPDPAGGSLRYERDDLGWYVDGGEGQRFRVVPYWNGVELHDRRGAPVARSQPPRSNLAEIEPGFDRTPGIDRLDPDGDGQVPIPNPAILDMTTGAEGRGNEVTRDGRTTQIDVNSGERRTYREVDGDVDVTVDPGYSGVEHRYRVDPRDDSITVYDEDDDRVLSLDVDREGNALEGLDELDDLDVDEQQPDADDDRPSPPWRTIAIVVAVLAAVGAGIAVWIWWRRRQGDDDQADRDWAEEQVRKLEGWGRDHTFPRERAETVVRYAARLDHEIARDGSLHDVGDVLDDALFGRRPLPADARLRTEATIDRLIEEHPKPGRAERLRGGPDHGDDREPAGSGRRR